MGECVSIFVVGFALKDLILFQSVDLSWENIEINFLTRRSALWETGLLSGLARRKGMGLLNKKMVRISLFIFLQSMHLVSRLFPKVSM